MKTIDDRIDSTVADLFWEEKITATVISKTLRKHFSEPWLDKPDTPGWWWLLESPRKHAKAVFVVQHRDGTLSTNGDPVDLWDDSKWQRAIGPSE